MKNLQQQSVIFIVAAPEILSSIMIIYDTS